MAFVTSVATMMGVLASLPAVAQPATVAVYSLGAADPNTAMPIAAPVSYVPTCPVSPKAVETTPIVNPIEGAYDNPADPQTDCTVDLRTQMAALPSGNYKAAVKLGIEPYGPFSTAFAVSAAQASHPCDGADPTSGTVVAGARTLSWCYPDGATGGSPITGWAVYVDGARSTPQVTAGTVNSAGRRLYQSSLTVAVGTRQIQVAPINAIGEGNRSAVFALSVQAPATAPTGTPGIRGVN